jgi:hypothetical protein
LEFHVPGNCRGNKNKNKNMLYYLCISGKILIGSPEKNLDLCEISLTQTECIGALLV